MIGKSSPLFFERYELKYHIPARMIEPICRFISPYCAPDPHTQLSFDSGGDGYYPINNLYLDTPNFQMLERKQEDLNDTINLRVRSYGERPAAPYFLEVKHSSAHGIKKKYRAVVNSEDWGGLLKGEILPEETRGLNTPDRNLDLFLRLLWSHQAEPKIITRYRRRAYESTINGYARVTFDKDLQYFPQERDVWSLEHDPGRMISYDDETAFDDEQCTIVMELKCTVAVPLWFLDLVSAFRLEQASLSKYGLGVAQIRPFQFVPGALRNSRSLHCSDAQTPTF